MSSIEFIIQIIIGIVGVIGLLCIGIYIGREHGSFEKFVLKVLDSLIKRMEKK